MLEKIIFLILSALTLGGALVVVTQRNLFRAAVYLVLALMGVAGMFVLLDAGFLAVVQVFIYAGAIAILIIFAVMVTRRVMTPDVPQQNTQWAWALGLVVVLFFILLLTLWSNQITLPVSDVTMGGVVWPVADKDAPVAGVEDLGRALVDVEQYALPFEVASVLLLMAMIGAVYVVFPRRGVSATDAEVAGLQPEAEESQ
jgi:NADH:ubiquinone oxidoreductase subunit 6 (subunit J)